VNTRQTILYVHQSSDLYGSDKTLLYLVCKIDRRLYQPLVVVPRDGPLVEALRHLDVDVRVLPLVLLRRGMFRSAVLWLLPFKILRSLWALNRAFSGKKIDIVHSNTLAVLSGALWAKLRGIRHVWHVHEIIVHPRIAGRIFSLLVRFLADVVVCNSTATRDFLVAHQPRVSLKARIIWNGIEREVPVDAAATAQLRRELGVSERDILVALVGRINRLKGQGLLVEAAKMLQERGHRNLYFLLVGSPPEGQEHYRRALHELIRATPVGGHITVMDYQENVWPVWDACDIAVVPSTEPESFGLVALEAMASRKPVVASRHGGITDIVVDRVTGLLFESGNVTALAQAIAMLARDKALRRRCGEHGFSRFREHFGLVPYVCKFEGLYREVLGFPLGVTVNITGRPL